MTCLGVEERLSRKEIEITLDMEAKIAVAH